MLGSPSGIRSEDRRNVVVKCPACQCAFHTAVSDFDQPSSHEQFQLSVSFFASMTGGKWSSTGFAMGHGGYLDRPSRAATRRPSPPPAWRFYCPKSNDHFLDLPPVLAGSELTGEARNLCLVRDLERESIGVNHHQSHISRKYLACSEAEQEKFCSEFARWTGFGISTPSNG